MNSITDAWNVTSTWLPWTALQTGVPCEIVEHTGSAKSREDYLAEWEQWRRAPHHPERERRAEAVTRAAACIQGQSQILDLTFLGLTCLPELPPFITVLNVDANSLNELPALPKSLTVLSVKKNKLTALPRLPPHLVALDASANCLTRVLGWPDSITCINISKNQLATLPALPGRLQSLCASQNQLTALPALPDSLSALLVDDNLLTHLPALPCHLESLSAQRNRLMQLPAFPASLVTLVLNDNLLTAFPVPLPDSLSELYIKNNKIMRLPENILSASSPATRLLFSRLYIELSGNPLSLKTIAVLKNNLNSALYRGPIMVFDRADSAASAMPALPDVVADWFPDEEKESALSTWTVAQHQEGGGGFSRGIARDATSLYHAFNTFLFHLRDTVSMRDFPEFTGLVATWLSKLAVAPTLRAATMALARDAPLKNDLMAIWRRMQAEALLHDVNEGAFDNKLPELIATGRERFRLLKLDNFVRRYACHVTFINEVEFSLSLASQLRDALRLTSVAPASGFMPLPGVTADALTEMEAKIKKEEDAEFPAWLALWMPWQHYIARNRPDDWQQAQSARKLAYEREGMAMRAAQTRSEGTLSQDIDLACFSALTRKVLRDTMNPSLLNKQWQSGAWAWFPWIWT